MKSFAVGLVLVLTVYSNAMAQNVAPECALDLRGTSRSNGMRDYVVTDSSGRARTLEDFRNAAVNYFFHNNSGIAARGLLVGTFASGFSQIAIPICNNLGQCVTTRISPTFSGSISVGGLISIGGDIVHTGYRISVETWGAISQHEILGLHTTSSCVYQHPVPLGSSTRIKPVVSTITSSSRPMRIAVRVRRQVQHR